MLWLTLLLGRASFLQRRRFGMRICLGDKTPQQERFYFQLLIKNPHSILDQNITVPGFSPLFPDAHCTSDGDVCQLTTGEGGKLNHPSHTLIPMTLLNPSPCRNQRRVHGFSAHLLRPLRPDEDVFHGRGNRRHEPPRRDDGIRDFCALRRPARPPM